MIVECYAAEFKLKKMENVFNVRRKRTLKKTMKVVFSAELLNELELNVRSAEELKPCVS
jgi:hypothetical protein